MLGFLLGANVVGLIIQMTSYRSLFPVIGACGLAAAILAFFIRIEKTPDERKAAA
jgi:predicted MFS family arabinose efflux permease